MAVNKVEFGNETLIDLTGDTVTASQLLSGVTAHDKTGAGITGDIPNKGTLNGVISSRDQTINIPIGYYGTKGSVNINDSDRGLLTSENIRRGIRILEIDGTCSNVQVGWFNASQSNVKSYTLKGLKGRLNSLMMVCPGTMGYDVSANNNRLSRLCYIPNMSEGNAQYISAQAYAYKTSEKNAALSGSNVVFHESINDSAGSCVINLPNNFMFRYQYIWAAFYV